MRLAGAVLGLVLALLWALSLAQPPLPTAVGLDESWRIGLTLAAMHGLRFGQDVVFTFGPLGYALQGVPEPSLAGPTAAVTALLAAVAALGVWTAAGGRGGAPLKLAFVAVAVFFATNVSLDYAAFLGVVALLARAGRFPRAAPYAGLVVGAVGAVGLLSKYTLGADALAAGAAVWVVAAVRGPSRRRRAAVTAAAIAFAITGLALATAFGFSPAALSAYLRGAAAISAGYSGGMALAGPRVEVAVALAAAAAVLALAVAAVRERKPEPAVLAAVVLFLAWKHGFVRQDGHILYFFGTVAALAPLLGSTLRGKPAAVLGVPAAAVALVALLWAQSRVMHQIPPFFHPGRIASGAAFLLQPRRTLAELAAGRAAALAPDRLPRAVRERIGSASVDVLPWETAIVAADDLTWDPLPVFQSYSAYTPALDGLNRDALAAHGAAYELVRYLAIDQRFVFGEAPATTAELLCRYAVAEPSVLTEGKDEYVLMQRRDGAHCDAEPAGRVAAALNAPVAVPAAGSPDAFVTAAFDIRPTLPTALRTAVWRAPRAYLTVRYDDGTTATWRATASTLPDGLVVSAAPRDAAEAARFFARRPVRAVRAITLVAPPGSYALDGVTFTRERRR
jgi:hypothetical protein